MIQRASSDCLLCESMLPLRTRSGRLREDLDRDFPSEARVAGPIDFTHAAGAERAQNLVCTETGAGMEWHVLKDGAAIIQEEIRLPCPSDARALLIDDGETRRIRENGWLQVV